MRLFILFGFFLLSLIGQSQEVYTLENCIETALSNNLNVKQAELNLDATESQLRSTKGNMLPNLNAFGTHNYNWGQRIDPFTNQFASTRVRSNSFGLNSNVMLFNGFQNQQDLMAQQATLKSAESDLQTQKNNIALSVASAYLQVILSEELINVAERQVAITDEQLLRIQKMVQAGSENLAAQYELEAQLARDRANLVQRRNDYQFAMLQLKQIMLLPEGESISLQKPAESSISLVPSLESAETIYGIAESSMPEVKGAEYQVLSQEHRLKQAKSGWYPSLTLSGSLGSGYSGLRTEVVSVTQSGTQSIGVTASGETVLSPTFETMVERISFSDQISDNFNQFIGLSLNVPIFNRFAVSNSVEQSRINRSISEIQVERTKQDLRQRVEQARFDAIAAAETYTASQQSLNASEKAFEFSEARFEAGALNLTDFTNSKNNLQVAQSQLLQAKYDYLFRLKVLEFYKGEPIRLN